jgi:hypothetical protein
VRFQVLTAARMRMTVFRDVAPCSLVEIDRRFRGAYCLHNHRPDEAVSTSETSANFYEITGSYIPEDSHPHTYIYICANLIIVCCVRMKIYVVFFLVMMLWSLVGSYLLLYQSCSLKMEVIGSSETLVATNKTTWRHNSECHYISLNISILFSCSVFYDA